jgi:hypothetical protein
MRLFCLRQNGCGGLNMSPKMSLMRERHSWHRRWHECHLLALPKGDTPCQAEPARGVTRPTTKACFALQQTERTAGEEAFSPWLKEY